MVTATRRGSFTGAANRGEDAAQERHERTLAAKRDRRQAHSERLAALSEQRRQEDIKARVATELLMLAKDDCVLLLLSRRGGARNGCLIGKLQLEAERVRQSQFAAVRIRRRCCLHAGFGLGGGQGHQAEGSRSPLDKS